MVKRQTNGTGDAFPSVGTVSRSRNVAGKTDRKRSTPVAAKDSGADVVATFSLAGCQWKVVRTEGLSEQGLCDSEQHTIRIRAGMTEQNSQATFYHELVHAIMFTMGKTGHDEEFVNTFGEFLHQFQRTMNET